MLLNLQRLYLTKFPPVFTPSVLGRNINRRAFICQHPYQGTNETVLVVDGETNAPIGQVSRKEYNEQGLWCRKSFVFV